MYKAQYDSYPAVLGFMLTQPQWSKKLHMDTIERQNRINAPTSIYLQITPQWHDVKWDDRSARVEAGYYKPYKNIEQFILIVRVSGAVF